MRALLWFEDHRYVAGADELASGDRALRRGFHASRPELLATDDLICLANAVGAFGSASGSNVATLVGERWSALPAVPALGHALELAPRSDFVWPASGVTKCAEEAKCDAAFRAKIRHACALATMMPVDWHAHPKVLERMGGQGLQALPERRLPRAAEVVGTADWCPAGECLWCLWTTLVVFSAHRDATSRARRLIRVLAQSNQRGVATFAQKAVGR